MFNKEAYKLLHDGVLALSRVEQQGLRIDVRYIERQERKIDRKIKRLEQSFFETDFYKEWEQSKRKVNIYSPAQLSTFLYKVKKYKSVKKTASGGGSTDEEALKLLNIPALGILLEIKKLKKVKDTYLLSIKREQTDGQIHPFYNLHNVRSFRSSSNSPNFQNMPVRDKESMLYVRRAIFPRKGHQLMEVDYGQLEVRIAASYCGDSKLAEDILHGDMHRDMAVELFKLQKYVPEQHNVLRQAAKNGFIFPQFYGDYYKNCADNMACTWGKLPKTRWKSGMGIEIGGTHLSDMLIEQGIRSYTVFENHVQTVESDFWQRRYKAYNSWRNKQWETYKKTGHITSLTGFVFQGIMSRNDVYNYPIQGAAFHCLLWSLIELMKAQTRERWKTKIVGQIHDSILFDVHPDELDYVLPVIQCIMCNDVRQHWKWITVPLEIEADLCPVNASWAEKKPYTFET